MAKEDHLYELHEGGKNYTYYAFISYKREDEKWAVWLHRRLQAYRLPSRICKNNRKLQRRCVPVFRDKTNLRPGDLETGLCEEVQSAKFLIVVCSRRAHENSKYLDLEIRRFLEGGGDPARIIPFIVDDSKQPEKDCFPLELEKLCADRTILGANIFEAGKRMAFLKAVAYMHGLKLEEMESADRRRQKRRLALCAALSLAVIAGIGIGLDYYLPKTAYYLDYTEQWGVPVGIHPLSAEEMKSLSEHYTIVSRQGLVRELRCETSYGELITPYCFWQANRPSRVEYEYTADRTLNRVHYFGAWNQPLLTLSYSKNLRTADLRVYEIADSFDRGVFLSALPEDANGPIDTKATRKSSIVRYLYFYDDNGFVEEMHYACDTARNYATSDAEGIFGLRFERDEKGRAVKKSYLTNAVSAISTQKEDYQPTANKLGVAGFVVRYNAQDQAQEAQYFRLNGQPAIGKDGYAILQAVYNGQGNISEERCLDESGKPILCKGGYASMFSAYNERGDKTDCRLFDTNGKPVMIPDGYASWTAVYGETMDPTEWRCFDADEKPVLCVRGYASFQYAYDAQERRSEYRFFGTDGQPIVNTDGFSVYRSVYNEFGNLIEESYFGIDGQLVLTKKGYASFQCVYDQGKLTRQTFLDTDGKPILCGDGYASIECVYDEQGNRTECRYYGADGQPILSFIGSAATKYVYDERGNIIEQYFLDGDGKPVLNSKGYSTIKVVYDIHGNNVECRCFGTDGRPVLCNYGYAVWKGSYDWQGNRTMIAFFGADGAPVLCSYGYASSTAVYDGQGRMTECRYFGLKGEPILNNITNAAGYYIQYDENSGKKTITYFDVNGLPL